MRQWDGQTVVYDQRSGDTHCLDRTASAVIACLSGERDLCASDIRDVLKSRGHDDDFQDRGGIEGILEELERLGLARHVSS